MKRRAYNKYRDVEEQRALIRHFFQKILPCSAVAVESKDYTVVGYSRFVFNICGSQIGPVLRGHYSINTWIQRVLSVKEWSVPGHSDDDVWGWLNSRVPKTIVNYEKRMSTCVIANAHIGGERGRHVFTAIFPWMANVNRRRDKAGCLLHRFLHTMMARSDNPFAKFGVGRAYDDLLHSEAYLKGAYTPGLCPKTGCAPRRDEFDLAHSDPAYCFARWVEMMRYDLEVVLRIHREPKCYHDAAPADVDPFGVSQYNSIRDVVSRLKGEEVFQAPFGALSGDKTSLMVRVIKQYIDAPMTRCTGMSESSPMCNEMGILTR
jgi:hypothetical protein